MESMQLKWRQKKCVTHKDRQCFYLIKSQDNITMLLVYVNNTWWQHESSVHMRKTSLYDETWSSTTVGSCSWNGRTTAIVRLPEKEKE